MSGPKGRRIPKAVFDARKSIRNAAKLLKKASDPELQAILADGLLDDLLAALGPPKVGAPGATIYERLLDHRFRYSLVAGLHRVISENYTARGTIENGEDVYVSPIEIQWFDDGVMFKQGKEPFVGLLGLYRGGQHFFALAARDAIGGDVLGKVDFEFIPVEEARRRQEQAPRSPDDLEAGIDDLERLLSMGEQSEAPYQAFFERHPWVFGAKYVEIQAHLKLDDKTIPDFTGVRVRDSARDIIEIKAPFLNLFTSDGSFSAAFNAAWQQAIRYRQFVVNNADYVLREKGLRFSSPECIIIAGRRFSETEQKSIRAYEQSTPGIFVQSYQEVLNVARHTKNFLVRPLSGVVARSRPEVDEEGGEP